MLARSVIALLLAVTIGCPELFAQESPESELVRIVRGFLAKDFDADWLAVEKLPFIRWAALPPTWLEDCLPDGNCFTRQGTASVGRRNITALAAGARTIAATLYLRNTSTPFGEQAVLAALRDGSFRADLVRCPVPGAGEVTNWYRLQSPTAATGVLAIQSSCAGAVCENLVVTLGESLPALQAHEVRLFSEQCGPGEERKPVSTILPHELLAQGLIALIPPANSPALYDWAMLTTLKSGVQWFGKEPRRTDLTFRDDPNPLSLTGLVIYASRRYHLLASGSETQVKTVYIDEGRFHRPGEDILGLLRSLGFTIQLVRCGPVYTESSNNWYRVTSEKTRPVMLQHSIGRDGSQLHESFVLRLDSTLPPGDPRDRTPGVGGCI